VRVLAVSIDVSGHPRISQQADCPVNAMIKGVAEAREGKRNKALWLWSEERGCDEGRGVHRLVEPSCCH
jgi:hypothetical protein